MVPESPCPAVRIDHRVCVAVVQVMDEATDLIANVRPAVLMAAHTGENIGEMTPFRSSGAVEIVEHLVQRLDEHNVFSARKT